MGLGVVLEYLVLKQMAGKSGVLRALFDYLGGERPSVVEARYGVSRYQLRGFVQRLVGRGVDRYTLRVVSLRAIPVILDNVKPIMITSGCTTICTICGKAMGPQFPEDHIRKKHEKELLEWVGRVSTMLKNQSKSS